MRSLRTPPPHRPASANVQHIRSPLTRVGFLLPADTAHLILLLAGELRFRNAAGDLHLSVEGPRLLWRSDGGGQELVAEGGARGILLSIPKPAMLRALPVSPLGDRMRQTLRLDLSLPQAHPARLETLLRGLDAECSEADPGFELASDHFLALILVQFWRQARADLVTHGRAPQGLAERFVLLAGTHFREHWHVEGYAAALGVSRGRLGSAVRRTTGLSPQGYLHRELLREASELLLNTGMPVGQIAFRLGYSDPAYFTRFFTRKTGQSPERFRRARKVQRRTGDASFAAWP